MENKNKDNFVECECGARVYGNYSKLSAEKNLPAHRTSKKHKELMEIKKRGKK